MFLSILLTCLVAVAVTTGLLLVAGHRVRIASRVLGIALGALIALFAGVAAAHLWKLPSHFAWSGVALVSAAIVLLVLLRPDWNPLGQVFFGSFLASALAYLSFAAFVTVAGGLHPVGIAASLILLCLEVAALVISGSFAFESCDVMCRVRWRRDIPDPDPAYLPKVSLQVAAYNEPPEMLIETIQSLEALDYPDFEILVIDNNTKDPDVWEPVQRYCAQRKGVSFVHVDPWPGFKSGALNLALRHHTDPQTEIVGVVDADYLVRPDWLRRTVGYFADPKLAFVQTPQDYRDYEGDTYLTACYDAYKYFFETSMPSRNQRNSIIFGGTMGLIRRSVIDELGGWSEWCITEDAEASLRMLRSGYSGLFLNESFGRGIMPLTFSALKRQRFRWAFGGIQILRMHLGSLLPWNRDPKNRLTLPQRFDYLLGGFQWFTDLVSMGFSLLLLTAAVLLFVQGQVALRPLLGVAVMLPVLLIASGVLRALWTLKHRTDITLRRALFAFVTWLSLSWTVALACVLGLLRSEGVFLRTPKWTGRVRLTEALRETRVETSLAAGLWALAALVAFTRPVSPFLIGLLVWQGGIYACSPFMSWLNLHTELSARLERRRRTEERRERVGGGMLPAFVGSSAVLATAVLVLVLGLGAQPPAERILQIPERAPGDRGPLGIVEELIGPQASPTPATPRGTSPSPATTPGEITTRPSPTPLPDAVTPAPGTTPGPPTAEPRPTPPPPAPPAPPGPPAVPSPDRRP